MWTAKVSRNSADHQTEAKIEGGLGKIAVGVGLVGTAAVGDVPGSAAGVALLVNAVLGGTSTAVNGTTDVLGAATHTDVSEAQEVLSATQNVPGLVTTAATGGNLKAGDAAATIGNAASLATSPKEALKNPATMADSAQTVKDSGGLIQGAVSAVRNFFSPAPPAAPKPPPPPSCSVAGACK